MFKMISLEPSDKLQTHTLLDDVALQLYIAPSKP